MAMRVLIADDTPAVRSAVRRVLNEEKDVKVAGEASNLAELITQVRAEQPDLILLDWELSGMPGSTKYRPKTATKSDKKRNVIIASLRQGPSQPFVIVLSSNPGVEQSSLASGADAFVFKGDPPERLLLTIRALIECQE